MSLENITGNLLAYKELEPGTMRHVDELMNEQDFIRLPKPEDLREQWFYTADGEVYFLDGVSKTPTLAITREAQNPVLQHIDDALDQLTQNKNYHVLQADFEKALTAPETVLIALPNLRLSKYDSKFSFLTLGTTPAKYNRMNDEERKLAERVYGQGDDFVQNMKMLKKAKISETKIFVLNPDYVRKHAETSAVAWASWLYVFFDLSFFGAVERNISNRIRVRGVRKKSSNDLISFCAGM